jgi:hypothetical protein
LFDEAASAVNEPALSRSDCATMSPTSPPTAGRCSRQQARQAPTAEPMPSPDDLLPLVLKGILAETEAVGLCHRERTQRLELAAKRPETNKSAVVDAALDRFAQPGAGSDSWRCRSLVRFNG